MMNHVRTLAKLKEMWILADKCSYLITANAPQCSEPIYRGAVESGLYPLKPPQCNGRSNRRQAGEVLLISTVVAAVMAIVHLLLVMSGDVEENPGPLGEDPTLIHKNVVNALKKVVDWKSLGDQLDITAAKINEIDVNNRGQVADCRRALVQFWLQSDVSRSWEKLIDALKAIDHSVLAEEIRTKYCSTYQVIQPTVSTSTPVVVKGGLASLSCNLNGTELNGANVIYNWTKDGEDLSDNGRISGSTQSTLNITNVDVTDKGAYACSVSVRGVNSPVSSPVTLTVDARAGTTSQSPLYNVRWGGAIAGCVTATTIALLCKWAAAGVIIWCGVGGAVGVCTILTVEYMYSLYQSNQKKKN